MANAQVKEQQSSDETKDIGGVSGQRLRSYLDRIERLETEKKHWPMISKIFMPKPKP